MKGFILLGAAVVLFLLWHLHQRRKLGKRHAVWEEVAAAKGLQYLGTDKAYPAIKGDIDGIGIDIRVIVHRQGTGSRRSTTLYTDCSALLEPPLPYTLRIKGRDLFQKMATSLGGQDVKTGDQEVDNRLRIEAGDQAQVLRLVSDGGVRSSLLEFFAAFGPNCSVIHQGIGVRLVGISGDREGLIRIIEMMVNTAVEIRRASGAA